MIAPLTVRNSFGMSSSVRPQSYQDGKTIPRCPQFWDSLWMMWLRYHFQTIPCFYIGTLQEKRKNKSTVVAIVHGIHHATLQHRRSFTFHGYIIHYHTIIYYPCDNHSGCRRLWWMPSLTLAYWPGQPPGMPCIMMSWHVMAMAWTWTSWTMDLANSIWLEVLSNKM